MLEESPSPPVRDFLDGSSRTGRHRQQPGRVVQLFVGFRQMRIDTGGIQRQK